MPMPLSLLEGHPLGTAFGPWQGRRTSLFRFEGTALSVFPGGAPSQLVEPTAPCVPVPWNSVATEARAEPALENSKASTSILFSKLQRANGGCLGA
jgi:hypothetical protein